MIFEDNKYARRYFAIIEKAKTVSFDGYVEEHHVVPKSLGGNNKSANLVDMPAKWHFVCHLLLVKAVREEHRIPMQHALFRMMTPKKGRIWTAGQYEMARRHHAEATSKRMKGRVVSLETRAKMSASLKGRKPTMTADRMSAIGAQNKGKKYSEEHKKNIGLARKKYWEERRATNH